MKCLFPLGHSEFLDVLQVKLGEGYEFHYGSPEVLKTRKSLAGFDVVIICVPHHECSTLENVLGHLEAAVMNAESIPVVAFIPAWDPSLVRELFSRGVYDYFAETQSLEELRIVLRRARTSAFVMRQVQQQLQPHSEDGELSAFVGSDPAVLEILGFAKRVAKTGANVLITGETGTGKELMARSIHEASARRGEPFIAVACSSLPESLIEAELFGHEKGAFTGAVSARRGRFEAAEGGTIFLDEIGELSAVMQVKLLRVLQERCFERIGSNQQRKMEARVICATNRDLRTMCRTGSFRSDLYYRVNTVEIKLPPLRERRGDILTLANIFLENASRQIEAPMHRLSSAAACMLRRYSWPGNVRELQHVIERAVLVATSTEIEPNHLPPEIVLETCVSDTSFESSSSFEQQVKQFKRDLIIRALRASGDNKVRAAKELCISRSSLHRLIEELEISSSQSAEAVAASLPDIY